ARGFFSPSHSCGSAASWASNSASDLPPKISRYRNSLARNVFWSATVTVPALMTAKEGSAEGLATSLARLSRPCWEFRSVRIYPGGAEHHAPLPFSGTLRTGPRLSRTHSKLKTRLTRRHVTRGK